MENQDHRRRRWVALGVAVAASVGVGGVGGVGGVDATTGSGERTVFVPIEPCRLFDTRPTYQVGPRSTPIGPGEALLVSGVGTVGECDLPDDVAGLVLNVTAVAPTAPTDIVVFADGLERPNASHLNPFPGQPPTPNAVTTDLGRGNRFRVSNRFGSVHVLADAVGYYADHHHDDRYYRKDEVDARIATLEAKIAALEAKTVSMSQLTVDGQPTVRFDGVNVQIVDGSGHTGKSNNGRGNLIVGYNENNYELPRTGSHNLVVGVDHGYTSWGGVVFGNRNTISGKFATVTGGSSSSATADWSTVSGGYENSATGLASSVTGGEANSASGWWSSVAGGYSNSASGLWSSVTGGYANSATADRSAVTGGFGNTANGAEASVTGGYENVASGGRSTVTGGNGNEASGVSGSVTGGSGNTASGDASSVSGGATRSVTGTFDWRAGSAFEDQ